MVGDSTRGFTTQKRLELYILEAENRASKKAADKAKGKGTGGSGSLKAAVQPAPNGTNVDAGKVARATGLPPEQAVAVSNAAASSAARKLAARRIKDSQRVNMSHRVRGRTDFHKVYRRKPKTPDYVKKYNFNVPEDVALPYNHGRLSAVYNNLAKKLQDGSRTERAKRTHRWMRYGERMGIPYGPWRQGEPRGTRFSPEGKAFQRYLQYNNVSRENVDEAARAWLYHLRQVRNDEALRRQAARVQARRIGGVGSPDRPRWVAPTPLGITAGAVGAGVSEAVGAPRAIPSATTTTGTTRAVPPYTVSTPTPPPPRGDGPKRIGYTGPTEPPHDGRGRRNVYNEPKGPLGRMFNRRTHSYQGYIASDLAANAVTEIKDAEHLSKLIFERAADLRSKYAMSRLSTGEPIATNVNLSKEQMDSFGRSLTQARNNPDTQARNKALWQLDKEMGVAERTLDKARRMQAARLDPYGRGTYDGMSVIDPKMRRDMYTMAKSIGSKQDMAFIEKFDPDAVDATALQRRYSRIMSRYKSLDAQNPRSGYGTYLDGSLLTSGKGNVTDWIQRARRVGVDASLINRYTDMATEKGVTTDTGRTFYDYTKERPQLKHLIRATEKASQRVDNLAKATDKSRQVFDNVISGKSLLQRRGMGKFDSARMVNEYAKAMKAQRVLGMISGTEESARVGEFTRAAKSIRTATKYNQLAGELERAAKRARANIRLEEHVDALQREGLLSEQSATAHRTRLRKKIQAQELRAHRWEVNRDAFKYSLTGRPIDTSQGFFKGVKSAAGQAGSDFGKMFKFNKVNLAMAIFDGVMKALRAWMTLARFGAMYTAVGIGATAMGARALLKTSDEYTNRQNLYNFALPEKLRGERSFQQFEDMAYVRGRGLRQRTSTWSSGVMELANAVASATDASGRQLISNMDQVIAMYENLSRMQKLAGTSEADFKGVMIQVLQGIGKGKLDMQDIKPILNRSGAFADLLARRVFGLRGRGDLYTQLDEGRGDRTKGLTAERLISGLLSSELTKDLDALFRKTARTWADVGEIMKSDIGRALLPLIQSTSSAGNGSLGSILTGITGALADSSLGMDIKNWLETKIGRFVDSAGGFRGAIEECVHSLGSLGFGLMVAADVCVTALHSFVKALTGVVKFIDFITPGGVVNVGISDAQRKYGWTDEQTGRLNDLSYYRLEPITGGNAFPGDVHLSRRGYNHNIQDVVFNPTAKTIHTKRSMEELLSTDDSIFQQTPENFIRGETVTLLDKMKTHFFDNAESAMESAFGVIRTGLSGAKDAFEDMVLWQAGDKKPDADAKGGASLALSALTQTAANTAAIKHNTAKATEVQIALLKQVAGRAVVNRITNVRPNIVANVGSIKSGADLDEVMKRLEIATASAVAGYAY